MRFSTTIIYINLPENLLFPPKKIPAPDDAGILGQRAKQNPDRWLKSDDFITAAEFRINIVSHNAGLEIPGCAYAS